MKMAFYSFIINFQLSLLKYIRYNVNNWKQPMLIMMLLYFYIASQLVKYFLKYITFTQRTKFQMYIILCLPELLLKCFYSTSKPLISGQRQPRNIWKLRKLKHKYPLLIIDKIINFMETFPLSYHIFLSLFNWLEQNTSRLKVHSWFPCELDKPFHYSTTLSYTAKYTRHDM